MATNQLTFSKRISGLISIGAIPAALLGFIGDLFTPKHGYYSVLLIGIISSFLGLYIILSLLNNNTPWWFKFLHNPEINYIWQGNNPLLKYGVQAIIVFSFICLFSGYKSYQSQKQGKSGYLSSNFEIVGDFQKKILNDILEENKKINKNLEDIKVVSLNKKGFNDAISNNVNALNLYLNNQWVIENDDIIKVIHTDNILAANVIEKHNNNYDSSQCIELFNKLYFIKDEKYGTLINSLCGDSKSRKYISDKLSEKKLELDKENKKYNEDINNLIKNNKNCKRYIINNYNDWYRQINQYSLDGGEIKISENITINSGYTIDQEILKLALNIISSHPNGELKNKSSLDNNIFKYCDYINNKIINKPDQEKILNPWLLLDNILNTNK